jgi:hypothetical protein
LSSKAMSAIHKCRDELTVFEDDKFDVWILDVHLRQAAIRE